MAYHRSSNRFRLSGISAWQNAHKQLTVKVIESSFADVHEEPLYEHREGRFNQFGG
jgi:hypothetical protein